MRSKKSAVRFGLLAVLLISLSLASTSNAWSLYSPKVAAPELSRWYVDWWSGGIVMYLSCDTSGADIQWTWASGYREAPIPTSSSRLYERPLLATTIGQLKAGAFKTSWEPSDILVITIR